MERSTPPTIAVTTNHTCDLEATSSGGLDTLLQRNMAFHNEQLTHIKKAFPAKDQARYNFLMQADLAYPYVSQFNQDTYSLSSCNPSRHPLSPHTQTMSPAIDDLSTSTFQLTTGVEPVPVAQSLTAEVQSPRPSFGDIVPDIGPDLVHSRGTTPRRIPGPVCITQCLTFEAQLTHISSRCQLGTIRKHNLCLVDTVTTCITGLGQSGVVQGTRSKSMDRKTN